MIRIKKIFLLLFIAKIFLLPISSATNSRDLDSLPIIEQSADDSTLLRIYNQYAEHYYNINLDSCSKYNTLAFELLESNSSKKQKIITYNILGMLEGEHGFYKDGLNYLLQALDIAENIKDTFLIARLYNNIGVSYMQIQDNANAEQYLNKALVFKNNEDVKIAPIYINLGIINRQNGNVDDAYDYYNKALEISKIKSDTIGIVSATLNIAIILFDWGRHDESMLLMNESLNISRQIGDSIRVATSLFNIGQNYALLENYSTAEQYYDQCYRIVLEINNNELINSIYIAYARLHENRGETREALKYYKLFHQFGDSVFNIDKQNQIAELNIKFESIKINKELELLNKEKQINDDRMRMRKHWIIVLSIAAIVMLIFIFIIILIRREHTLSQLILVRKNVELAQKPYLLENTMQNNNSIILSNQDKAVKFDCNPANIGDTNNDNLCELIRTSLIEEKIFLNSNLTSSMFAKYLNISRNLLSQVINERFHKSFNTLINECRIIEARKELMQNENNTIEAIANKVGFNSKSSFNAAFKKYTGVTPSFFIENQ